MLFSKRRDLSISCLPCWRNEKRPQLTLRPFLACSFLSVKIAYRLPADSLKRVEFVKQFVGQFQVAYFKSHVYFVKDQVAMGL